MSQFKYRALALAPLLLPLPAAVQAAEGFSLEEVIVTAQKREESLQDTPISITAFGEEALTQQGISDVSDLQGKVPSLNMTPFPTQNTTPRMFIRGVGAGDVQVTQDPAVGIYIDQVYIGRSTGIALEVADLAQIEVLRGPQGTLFGRNSIGGAINMTTRTPEVDLLEFKQELGVGNENLIRSKTTANVPITDDIALRAVYFTKERDGWMDNDGPGRDWQDGKDEGGKLDLLWEPGDNWSIRYAYDYSRSEFANPTFQAILPGPTSDLLEIPVDSDRVNTLSTKDELGVSDTKIDGHALTITREWDSMTLKSITAYRKLEYWEFSNLESGSPSENLILNSNRGISLIGHRPYLDQDQWSQEFQLLGDLNDQLNYVIGAYYFDEEANKTSASGSQVFVQQPDQYQMFDIENESWAVFAQGNYTPQILDSRLTLTAGVRYTEDDRSAPATFVYDPDPNNASFSGDPDASFDNIDYTLIASYALTDDVNTYAKLATGYKSGGYNIRASSEEKYSAGFDEEEITTWELGSKGDFLDHRLRVNVATYFSVYEDIQLNNADLSTPEDVRDTLVFNAGEGEIFGVELDVSAVLLEGLTARVSYAYQDADFTDFDDLQNEGKTEDDFVFTNAPDHQYTAELTYFYAFNFGNLNTNLNYNWVDDRYDTQNTSQVDSGQAVIDSYGVWNAYASISDIELGSYGTLTVALWGKNLDDEEYFTSAPIILNVAGAYDKAVTWGEPRSYGVDLIYHFQN